MKICTKNAISLEQLDLQLRMINNAHQSSVLLKIKKGQEPEFLFNSEHGEPVFQWQPFTSLLVPNPFISSSDVIKEVEADPDSYEFFDTPEEAFDFLFNNYLKSPTELAYGICLDNDKDITSFRYIHFAPENSPHQVRLVKWNPYTKKALWHNLGFNAWCYNSHISEFDRHCKREEVVGFSSFKDMVIYVHNKVLKRPDVNKLRDLLDGIKYVFEPKSGMIYKIGRLNSVQLTLCHPTSDALMYCFENYDITLDDNSFCAKDKVFQPVTYFKLK